MRSRARGGGFVSCSDDDDDDGAKVVYTFTGSASEAGNLTLKALDDKSYSISSDNGKIGQVASGTYDATDLKAVKFTETKYYDLSASKLVSGNKEQTVDAHEGTFTYQSANGISVEFTLKE